MKAYKTTSPAPPNPSKTILALVDKLRRSLEEILFAILVGKVLALRVLDSFFGTWFPLFMAYKDYKEFIKL